jgi:Ser/Thr protein kinase RdoA (MazF antagonist)
MSSTSEPIQQNQNTLNAAVAKTPLATVEAIAWEHFGVAGSAVTLSSERDETFLIRADSCRDYILKIANPAERLDVLEFQTQALVHLEAKGLPLPLPNAVPTKKEETLVLLPFGNEQRIGRMLTFLDGQQLYKAPRSSGQMRALGEALALLGKGLADFKPQVPQQDLLWDICNATALSEFVTEVEPSRQLMVRHALDGFGRLADRAINALPRQVIHNDFNPHNVLVSQADPEVVTGVIDFGDMVEAPLINDLAVALSYQIGAETGFEDAIAMLSAYHRIRRLDQFEIACLPTLLRTRLAMTVVITEWRASLYPENRDYILRNHPIALSGLTRLADYSDKDLGTLFQQKIGDLS